MEADLACARIDIKHVDPVPPNTPAPPHAYISQEHPMPKPPNSSPPPSARIKPEVKSRQAQDEDDYPDDLLPNAVWSKVVFHSIYIIAHLTMIFTTIAFSDVVISRPESSLMLIFGSMMMISHGVIIFMLALMYNADKRRKWNWRCFTSFLFKIWLGITIFVVTVVVLAGGPVIASSMRLDRLY